MVRGFRSAKSASRSCVSSHENAQPTLVAGGFVQPLQQITPRGVEGLAKAANHVDPGIGGASFDALHITPVDFGEARQIILVIPLCVRTRLMFLPRMARRQTHSQNLREGVARESSLMVAHWRLQ